MIGAHGVGHRGKTVAPEALGEPRENVADDAGTAINHRGIKL